MNLFDYSAPAELYLGSDRQTAIAQGSRTFRSVANALRFAFEHAAPVSLNGALLTAGGRTFSGPGLAELYRAAGNRLPHDLQASGLEPRRAARPGRHRPTAPAGKRGNGPWRRRAGLRQLAQAGA